MRIANGQRRSPLLPPRGASVPVSPAWHGPSEQQRNLLLLQPLLLGFCRLHSDTKCFLRAAHRLDEGNKCEEKRDNFNKNHSTVISELGIQSRPPTDVSPSGCTGFLGQFYTEKKERGALSQTSKEIYNTVLPWKTI